MKTKLLLLATLLIALVVGFASCGSLETESCSFSGHGQLTPYQAPVYTAESLFPDGDPLPFLIFPMNGWTFTYGDYLMFKALLLDEKTGLYKDVTNDSRCVWNTSYGSGKMVHGNDPRWRNGMEVSIRCMWDKRLPGETVGHFVVDPEYEGHGPDW